MLLKKWGPVRNTKSQVLLQDLLDQTFWGCSPGFCFNKLSRWFLFPCKPYYSHLSLCPPRAYILSATPGLGWACSGCWMVNLYYIDELGWDHSLACPRNREKYYSSSLLPPVGTPSHLLNSRAFVHWFVMHQLAPSCPLSEDTEMGRSAAAGQDLQPLEL